MSTTDELRQLSAEELRTRVAELKQQIFDMKNKLHTGVLDSTAELGKARRTVAACLTLAREAELGVVRKPRTEKKAPKGKKE
jgi:large subunit ribosomal protein L29